MNFRTQSQRTSAIVPLAVWLCPLLIGSQISSETPAFEVASVKPLAPGSLHDFFPPDNRIAELTRFRGGPGTDSPTRITYRGVTLKMLLARAYNLKDDQIRGPGWLDEQLYEIVATLPERTDLEKFRVMLQQLLTERFQIKLHRDTKIAFVYALRAAKNGPKMRPAEKSPVFANDSEGVEAARAKASAAAAALGAKIRAGDLRNHRGLELRSASVTKFAEVLSSYLDHPVEDLTRLEGQYSFALQWIANRGGQSAGVAADPDDAQNEPSGGESIFDAVHDQLGLKLQLEKRKSEMLMIDEASKLPTDN
jgi:uncharacterized protein (TIGR03435 family)